MFIYLKINYINLLYILKKKTKKENIQIELNGLKKYIYVIEYKLGKTYIEIIMSHIETIFESSLANNEYMR